MMKNVIKLDQKQTITDAFRKEAGSDPVTLAESSDGKRSETNESSS